jgi:8-oxo-dGTP pyrophosphatase MutT (NUDIX family)
MLSLGEISKQLRHRLADPTQGVMPFAEVVTALRNRPRSQFAPQLSFGRHRGPALLRSRRAAVVAMCYQHRQTGQPCLTLTRRPQTLSHHAGQICLPGGKIEAGESSTQAAIREYEEELGVRVDVLEVLGMLSPIYVFGSDNLVDVVVLAAHTPDSDWQPDESEVEEVIEMPLECLVQIGEHTASGVTVVEKKRRRTGKTRRGEPVIQYEMGFKSMSFIDCAGHRHSVWGATAMILDELAQILRTRQDKPADGKRTDGR